MIKGVSLLGYPKYVIYQSEKGYKFNLDSLLIASFVRVKKTTHSILDVGAGNGAISMYLTLKTNAQITALELQESLVNLMTRSVFENGLENQIKIIHDDFKNATLLFKQNTFDCVVCNPPFFKVDPLSNLNEMAENRVARHEIALSLNELIKQSSYVLKNKGSLHLIHRPERLLEILVRLKEHKLEPFRIQFVYPNKDLDAKHVLIEAIKGGNESSLVVLKPLYIYNDQKEYTAEILKIFNFGRS